MTNATPTGSVCPLRRPPKGKDHPSASRTAFFGLPPDSRNPSSPQPSRLLDSPHHHADVGLADEKSGLILSRLRKKWFSRARNSQTRHLVERRINNLPGCVSAVLGARRSFSTALLGPPASSHPETSAFRRVSLRELGGTASALPRFHSPAGLPQRLPNNPCAPIEIRGRCLIKCVSIKCVSNVPSCRRTEPSSFRLCVSALTGIKSTQPKMAMADAPRFRGGHAVGYPLKAIAARHGEYGRFRRNHRRRGKPPEREGP